MTTAGAWKWLCTFVYNLMATQRWSGLKNALLQTEHWQCNMHEKSTGTNGKESRSWTRNGIIPFLVQDNYYSASRFFKYYRPGWTVTKYFAVFHNMQTSHRTNWNLKEELSHLNCTKHKKTTEGLSKLKVDHEYVVKRLN